MKSIPLNSLVLMVGPSGAGKSSLAAEKFPGHEIVSNDAIRVELVGDLRRQDITPHVVAEKHRRVRLKLSLGERVVVDATNLIRRDRQSLVQLGTSYGVPVFYIVVNRPLGEKRRTGGWRNSAKHSDKPLMTYHEELFRKNERDILAGDGVATAIDSRQEDFHVVRRIDTERLREEVAERNHEGFAVIGDAHNISEKLVAALEDARSANRFSVILGDIIDYGPDPLGCIEATYDAVMNGSAVMVLGNHERKVIRYYEEQLAALEEGYDFNEVEPSMRLSPANMATIQVINRLPDEVRLSTIRRFLSLCRQSRMHLHAGNLTFVHGAAHQDLFGLHAHRLSGSMKNFAYFGQTAGFHEPDESGNRFPNRIYDWVEHVPPTRLVFVGHDIRGNYPLMVANKRGGRVVFLDTGCGKGGLLSMALVPFTGNSLMAVERINQY